MSVRSKIISAGIVVGALAVSAPVFLTQVNVPTPKVDPQQVLEMRYDNQARGDLLALGEVMDAYQVNTGDYPSSAAELAKDGSKFTTRVGVQVAILNADEDGYCLVGTSRLGQRVGETNLLGGSAALFYYDGKDKPTTEAPKDCTGSIDGYFDSSGFTA